MGTEAETIASTLSAAVAAMNTGDTSSSTISDFLPLLRLLFDGGGSTTDTPDKIGVEFNNFLPLGKKNQHKFSAVMEKSEMFEPLKDALRAASLESQASDLADGIDQGDDLHFIFSYSRANENFGRDPDLPANQVLLSSMLHKVSQETIQSDATKAMLKASNARNEFIDDKRLDEFLKDADGNELPMSAIPEKHRARYIELTSAFILAASRSKNELAANLKDANFYQVLDLINNQPQLVGSVEYRARDEVVGPDEFKAVVSYESGGPNIKALRRYSKDHCATEMDVRCLAAYLDDPEVREELANGSVRYKLSLEYSELQQMDFTLANTAFNFLAEPVKHLTASAAMGFYYGKQLVGRKRARFDATASYEDFSDDPLRQDRGVAKLTVTYPISEGFFLSLGAVYATKPEFRGDADEEISARAGFTYKIIEGP
jgi:hypothetical protein